MIRKTKKSLFASSGRSMIEMLGVLAVIGVLSVGGIAGYSKAMTQYKLNKQTDNLNHIIRAVDAHHGSYEMGIITGSLISMGEIPQEMIKKDDTYFVWDAWDNALYVSCQSDHGIVLYYNIDVSSEHSVQICQNFVNIAKAWHSVIGNVQVVMKDASDAWGGSTLYGDKACKKYPGRTCIKDATVSDISNFCNSLVNGEGMSNVHMKIIWYDGCLGMEPFK